MILPNLLFAQERVTQYYITKDGVKTPIVFDPFSMDSDKSKFLYEKGEEKEYSSQYDKLKDASKATDEIFRTIDTIRKISSDSDGTFSLSGAKKNIELLQKERNSKRGNSTSSLEELVFLKEKYGDTPSFFVNDIEVSKEVFNKVTDREIMNREVLVQNTVSGNPNGEIRILVPDRVLKRLGISNTNVDSSVVNVDSYAFTQPAKETTILRESQSNNDINSGSSDGTSLDKLLKDIMQLDSKNSTESIVKNRVADAPKEQSVRSQKAVQQKQPVFTNREVVYSYDEMNNKNTKKVMQVQDKDEDVFVVRSSDWKKVEIAPENANEESEGKRSVRNIKERERSK